jgi:NitT/TauT family transport system permease protein
MNNKVATIKNKIFYLKRLLGIVVFLAIWEIAPRTGIVNANFLPPFSVAVKTLFSLLSSGELIKHILISLRRSVVGFALGFGFAIPFGILIGSFKKLEYYVDPLIQALRQTSTMALLPVFLLLFGIKEPSKYAIVFWGVWAPILLSTINGVKGVDFMLIKAAKSMGASQLVIFTRVIAPSAVPSIMTGLRLAATTSILILTAAEMMGASSGLGFLLYDAQMKYLVPKMFAVILTMSVIGITVNYCLVVLEKRVTRWKPKA